MREVFLKSRDCKPSKSLQGSWCLRMRAQFLGAVLCKIPNSQFGVKRYTTLRSQISVGSRPEPVSWAEPA